MARRSGIDQLLDVVDRHPALRAASLAVRMAWLTLARAMHGQGISVLRFGSAPVPRIEIAMMLAIAETELEPILETLLQRGLLSVDTDGAIGCPLLARMVQRSEINRANGLKGGRPRKADAPGQTHMMLPISGGAGAETEKTEPITKPAARRLSGQLASLSESEIKLARAVACEAKAQASIEGAPSDDEVAIVARWMRAGASEETILATIERKKRRDIRGLFYFDEPVKAAIDGGKGAPAAGNEARPGFNPAYRQAIEAWFANGSSTPPPRPEHFAAVA